MPRPDLYAGQTTIYSRADDYSVGKKAMRELRYYQGGWNMAVLGAHKTQQSNAPVGTRAAADRFPNQFSNTPKWRKSY